MTNIDEKVQRKINRMKEKVEEGENACPHSVNWFSIKDDITRDHLKEMIGTFYNLSWVKESYAEGRLADNDCEKYFYNATMRFQDQGVDVSDIFRDFPQLRTNHYFL